MKLSTQLLHVIACLLLSLRSVTAQSCPETCRLPECYCDPENIPGNLMRDETPQIVLVTYSDAMIDKETLVRLQGIFNKKRRNANDCPIAMTVFVTDNATDYCAVHRLYADGHELASYSTTRRTPTDWWANTANYDDWKREMVEEREKIASKGKVPEGEIVGARAPYLMPGGDEQFRMLENNAFVYDSSLLAGERTIPLWPFTLDVPFSSIVPNCQNPRCPTETYMLWEVPLPHWKDTNDRRCAFFDSCLIDIENSKPAILQVLWKNFNKHYDSNRAPFMINLRRAALTNKQALAAIDEFVELLSKRDEIWIMTIQEAIEWIKKPTPQAGLKSFKPWKCPTRRFNPACKPAEKVYLIDVIGISGRNLVIIEYVLLTVIFVWLVRRDHQDSD